MHGKYLENKALKLKSIFSSSPDGALEKMPGAKPTLQKCTNIMRIYSYTEDSWLLIVYDFFFTKNIRCCWHKQ